MAEPEPLALLLSDDVQTFLTRLLRRVYLSRVCESVRMIEKIWKKAIFDYDRSMKKLYIIGIDEAGRGSWAGPVVAGGWMAEASHAYAILDIFLGLDDSKKLTPKKREEIFLQIKNSQELGESFFAFSHRDARVIDSVGIREANRQSMEDVIRELTSQLDNDDMVEIWIDGRDNYRFQLDRRDIGYEFEPPFRREAGTFLTGNETTKIIYRVHGDGLHRHISAASIVAKVVRDHMMCEYSEKFPDYFFDLHKGYGTAKHREMLLKYGITPLHRKSYAPVKALISEPS